MSAYFQQGLGADGPSEHVIGVTSNGTVDSFERVAIAAEGDQNGTLSSQGRGVLGVKFKGVIHDLKRFPVSAFVAKDPRFGLDDRWTPMAARDAIKGVERVTVGAKHCQDPAFAGQRGFIARAKPEGLVQHRQRLVGTAESRKDLTL